MPDFRTGLAWKDAGAYTLKLRHTGSENVGGGQGAMITTDVSCTLATNQDQRIFQKGVDMKDYIVRRLMPIECERLQGFPDNWTRIEWKGKPEEECPDTRRYQACGNSMAVPVMRWIGERIEKVDSN